MPRTTVNIDAAVLAELKRRQQREGKSLGQLVSATLDTNVLVFGADETSDRHRARALLEHIATNASITYVFWPVLLGYSNTGRAPDSGRASRALQRWCPHGERSYGMHTWSP